MATARRTADIKFGTWTTIQISLSGANQLSDTQADDDLGGPGPHLVLERGIWKYPQQTSGGRIVIPANTGRPVRLNTIMANLGASSATWELHIAGYDGTANRPDNTTGEPYDAGDAALYREGDFIVASGTGQYLAENFDPVDAGLSVLIHPGQHVYMVTSNAADPIVRFTFNIAVENIG